MTAARPCFSARSAYIPDWSSNRRRFVWTDPAPVNRAVFCPILTAKIGWWKLPQVQVLLNFPDDHEAATRNPSRANTPSLLRLGLRWSGERRRPACCPRRPDEGGSDGSGETPKPPRGTRVLPGPRTSISVMPRSLLRGSLSAFRS
jgi:hypothetical protein